MTSIASSQACRLLIKGCISGIFLGRNIVWSVHCTQNQKSLKSKKKTDCVMWSHNKGAVGGKTSRLRAINFCL